MWEPWAHVLDSAAIQSSCTDPRLAPHNLTPSGLFSEHQKLWPCLLRLYMTSSAYRKVTAQHHGSWDKAFLSPTT